MNVREATADGGHKATSEAARRTVHGTFDRPDRMRRRRNDAEYPDIDTPDVTHDDARDAIESAQKMRDAAVALIASGKLGVFDPRGEKHTGRGKVGR